MTPLSDAVGWSYPPADFLALLATPAQRERIELAGKSRGLTAAAAMEEAQVLARGIAADFSFPAARAGDRFLSWLFGRMFDGIEVRGIETVRAAATDASLIYLPCHRSHLDYLLLSHVIYHGGLTPPHIAAGDNMNMPLLGRLLRKGGGFFMRRSFKGDALYATVFAAYLQGLLTRGLPIEFFIEGGRSRTGATLEPKTGLLGMIVEAWARAPERPLMLLPVYLGYEKLPEARGFLDELAGRPKRKESLGDVLAAARLVCANFGRPAVSFGQPLPLGAWLDARLPEWRVRGVTDYAALRPAVQSLATEIASRIDAAAVVNAVNLVAVALLEEPMASAPRGVLVARISALRSVLHATRVRTLSSDACIDRALALGFVAADGDTIRAVGDKAAELAYFRNNVQHLFSQSGETWTRSG